MCTHRLKQKQKQNTCAIVTGSNFKRLRVNVCVIHSSQRRASLCWLVSLLFLAQYDTDDVSFVLLHVLHELLFAGGLEAADAAAEEQHAVLHPFPCLPSASLPHDGPWNLLPRTGPWSVTGGTSHSRCRIGWIYLLPAQDNIRRHNRRTSREERDDTQRCIRDKNSHNRNLHKYKVGYLFVVYQKFTQT